MSITRLLALACTPALAAAQCDWQPVATPNPADEINVIIDSDTRSSSLYALLITDESFQQGNPVYPHVLRREIDGWTDFGGPDGINASALYLSLFADGSSVWLGGATEYDPALQAPAVIAKFSDGWQEPLEVDMINQVLYPFHERGGRVYAFDTAPDGTMFAVGAAKGYGLTDDNSIPLFLVNHGSGWNEVTAIDYDWPGSISGETYLADVIAFSSDNVWAVGQHASENGEYGDGGLIVHWDGSSLSVYADPRTDGSFIDNPLFDMDASGPDDIWAVGGSVFSPRNSTIAHFDGTEWVRVESPIADPLRSLAIENDGTVWAASPITGSSLAYFDGQAWTAAEAASQDALIQTMARNSDGTLWMLGQNAAADSIAFQLQCDCHVDINSDGRVDTQDVLAFLNLFATGDSGADFDHNGTVNTIDVLAFLNAFNEGCF